MPSAATAVKILGFSLISLVLRFLILDLVVLEPVLAGGSVGLGVVFLSATAWLASDNETRVAASLFRGSKPT